MQCGFIFTSGLLLIICRNGYKKCVRRKTGWDGSIEDFLSPPKLGKYWLLNKMPARKEFMKYWKNNSNVLSLPLSAMILLIVEEIMETEFKCPRWTTLKILYVLTYFLCPALITLGLSLSSQPTCILWFRSFGKCSYRQKGKMLCKVFLPPLIWIVILLWDGRYIECIVSRSEVDSNQNANQTRAAESTTEFYSYSQVRALGICNFRYFVCTYFCVFKESEICIIMETTLFGKQNVKLKLRLLSDKFTAFDFFLNCFYHFRF